MTHKLVTNWTDWRSCLGGAGSAQRAAAQDYLRKRAAILYYGDIWFCAPLRPTLALHSMAAIDGVGLVDGSPMATAERLFECRSLQTLQQRLLDNPFDILAISAGINDLLGSRLQRLFGAWHEARAAAPLSAEQAFAVLAEAQVFERLRVRYRAMLESMREVQLARPAFRVVTHGYAPLLKLGNGQVQAENGLLALHNGSDDNCWLSGPMAPVLGDRSELRSFARLIVERLHKEVIAPLLKSYSGLLRYADLSSVPELSSAGGWHDELTPTPYALSAAAAVFNSALRTALPSVKRKAIGVPRYAH